MKKSIIFGALIIILVFINWFVDGFAQTTEEQLKLRGQQPDYSPMQPYQSPPIYDEDGELVNDSLLTLHRQKGTDTTRLFQPEDERYRRLHLLAADSADTEEPHQLILPKRSEVERFGTNLFKNRHVGEVNTSQIPDDYLLGPGDNIIISLWGRVQQEWNVTVDRQGGIFIPKVGEITAWGMTLPEFEERLDAQLSKAYTGYKRKITLGKIRTIRVFVYGEVREPGGYAVSALSTLFNALYMAGGPNENGSFRQIRLIRNNKTILVDLYDFLIKGDRHCDLPLVSGDVIFVPLVGAQATIRGEVKRPAIYELTGVGNISDLIALAGGPTADAHLGRLMLDRISEDDSRKVIDLDFAAEEKQDLLLADGDDLSIFSIYQMRQNIVWITGEVKHPGTFERTENMRISDLLENAQLLPNNVYKERADLYRRLSNGRIEIRAVSLKSILEGNNKDNIPLADLDSLQIYCTDSVAREKHVYIDGMVKNPGRYQLYDNMTVSDLIFLAGNFNESAYMLQAELARIDSNGNTNVLYVPLNNRNNMILTENDQLFVRKIPGYQLHRTVTVEGEILFPGRYSLTQKNETLWELLGRAGGFTRKAFPIGVVFKRRAIIEDLKRKNIAGIIESSLPLLADSTGILKPVKTISFEPESMDRIIVDMEQLIATGGAEGDFKLQAGDYIFVPEMPTGVTVMGEVCASGTITYEPGEKVKHYLEQAGGFTRRADKGQTRLVKANGRVYASGTAPSKKAELGDVIIVPTEIKKERDWLKYFTTGASILTGVATTFLIFDRL